MAFTSSIFNNQTTPVDQTHLDLRERHGLLVRRQHSGRGIFLATLESPIASGRNRAVADNQTARRKTTGRTRGGAFYGLAQGHQFVNSLRWHRGRRGALLQVVRQDVPAGPLAVDRDTLYQGAFEGEVRAEGEGVPYRQRVRELFGDFRRVFAPA